MVTAADSRRGSIRDVFKAFLLLGVTAFGGPVAHLGYFRHEFVARRQWLSEQAYADLVALCQFLPGPASSQVGFAIGMQRAGLWGGVAAWTAFTLPSAVLLVMFALSAAAFDNATGNAIINGLKITAVAIVAHAVWGMARTLCPDLRRAGIALAALLIVASLGGTSGQLLAIVMGAMAGGWLCRGDTTRPSDNAMALSLSPRVSITAGVLFISLLIGLPLLAAGIDAAPVAVMDAFYRAGALVFGGGHVVLPLLQTAVVDPQWVSAEHFIAGYGAAQAIPGPLFTFAAYLGAVMPSFVHPAIGVPLALLMIFLPGILLLIAVLPYWQRLRGAPHAQALMRGTNAAVVGLLAAALIHPIASSALISIPAIIMALIGFLLLTVWRAPAWAVVMVLVAASLIIGG